MAVVLLTLIISFSPKNGLVISCTTSISEQTDRKGSRLADAEELPDIDKPIETETLADAEALTNTEEEIDIDIMSWRMQKERD